MSQSSADFALLRFLRARIGDTEVLNGGGEISAAGGVIAEELMRSARTLLAWSGQGGTPYAAIARSPEFAAYRSRSRDLHGFDPAALEGRWQRSAFWINIYNALVIDAVISFGVGDSIREALGFFHRAAYQIGRHRFSLHDIEHGLLRVNRPQFSGLPPPFAPGDPRATLGPGVLDPRVHFALNCGTRSCPPVVFYEADRLDLQLDTAAYSFINAEGVRVEGDEVVLSPLFEFYSEDFGGADGARQWVSRYTIDPELRERLAKDALHTGEYDWSLNRG